MTRRGVDQKPVDHTIGRSADPIASTRGGRSVLTDLAVGDAAVLGGELRAAGLAVGLARWVISESPEIINLEGPQDGWGPDDPSSPGAGTSSPTRS